MTGSADAGSPARLVQAGFIDLDQVLDVLELLRGSKNAPVRTRL